MKNLHDICVNCSQPMRIGDVAQYEIKPNIAYHVGACPQTDIDILYNLQICMRQGFVPQFCRTHYNEKHGEILQDQRRERQREQSRRRQERWERERDSVRH